VEKATKALGIKLKIISDVEEAKEEIGHHAWRLYSKMVEKFMEQIQKFEESWKVSEERILTLDSLSNQESKKSVRGNNQPIDKTGIRL
jgi:hypothetical protein